MIEELCMSCGACCAYFRVSFYWGESDLHPLGSVPASCIEKLDERFAVMRGTDSKHPRCEALEGTVGELVRCSIYAKRPTPCRAFLIHGQEGPNEACNTARAAHGLCRIDLGLYTAV
jgi:uncharacterized protein